MVQRNEKNENSFVILVIVNMDLNHLKLPGSVIADLYKSLLIDPDETTVTQAVTEIKESLTASDSDWKSLGENKKKVLILVNYQDSVYLPDNDLELLTGILGACKLSMADVAIVNHNNCPDATYKELVTFFKSKIVLLFAIEPASFGLPMNFPHFQIQPFAENSFLFSPSLKELENDKVLKSKLWVCLKRLFNL
jgi:hypothetical protein